MAARATATVLVNGVPGSAVGADDRGLLYGDGLFETLAVRAGRPLHWERHRARLERGCRRLAIACPDAGVLRAEVERVAGRCARGVVKIVVTRGPGPRGYRPAGGTPTRIVSAHAPPSYPPARARDGVAVRWCATRLGRNPALAGIKHLNRLEQVLAQAERDEPEIAEGLMQDDGGAVIEGTMSNLFAVFDGVLVTPDLSECGVAGITRERILEHAGTLGVPVQVRRIPAAALEAAQELFVCNTLIGIWPIRRLADREFHAGPLARRLAQALGEEDRAGGP